MTPWWQRLSDSELRARLTQHGVPSGRAELLVRGRDTQHHADDITDVLGAT